MTRKRGGSRASDAVTALVTPETYLMMSKTHTNLVGGKCKCQKCKKGGCGCQGGRFSSIANNAGPAAPRPTAVTSEQSAGNKGIQHIRELFDGSNYKLTNKSGGKRGGAIAKHVASETHHHHHHIPAKTISTHTIPAKADLTQHHTPIKTIQHSPAKTVSATTVKPIIPAAKVGGKKLGRARTVSHIKRGGAPSQKIGLDYSAIKSTGNINDASSRAINPISTEILANNSYEAVPSMNKVAKFGSVDTSIGNKFSYTGGYKNKNKTKLKTK